MRQQRFDRDQADPRHCPGKELPHLPRHCDLASAPSAGKEDLRVSGASGEEAKQLQRTGISPVQVVEHEHNRQLVRERTHSAGDGIEERRPAGSPSTALAVSRARASSPQSRSCRPEPPRAAPVSRARRQACSSHPSPRRAGRAPRAARASSFSAASRRVLPMPASPLSQTTPPRPAYVSARAVWSSSTTGRSSHQRRDHDKTLGR